MTDDSILARASSTTEWPDCQRRWAARNIPHLVRDAGFELRKVPNNIGAKVGTALHSGAAFMLQHKIDTGELSKKSDAVEHGIESLRREVQEGAAWDETSPNMTSAEQQTKRMVEIFHGVIAPTLRPVAVEQEMVARFSPTLRVIGHLDIAEDMGIDDNKTGIMRRPNHPQYGTYSLLRRSVGHTVSRVREHYVPRAPLSRTQPIPTTHIYPMETCEQAAHAVLKGIDAAVQTFKKNGDVWSFLPNPASMLCSDRFCPAHGTSFCRSHK